MSESYVGIDYGLGESNIDKATGIRFGVISQNSCDPESIDNIIQDGTDVAFQEARKEFLAAVVERIHHWFNNESWINADENEQRKKFQEIVLDGLKDNYSFSLSARVAEDTTENWGKTSDRDEIIKDAETAVDNHFGDHYESDNGLNDYFYEKNGYKLTGCLQTDVFILKSDFYSYAQFCSPCVPGAGNLDSAMEPDSGAPRCYCLGHDWFEEQKAPYRVWRVEDNIEIVVTEEQVPCQICKGVGRDTVSRLAQARRASIDEVIAGIQDGSIQVNDLHGEHGDATFQCWCCSGTGSREETVETDGEIDPNYAEDKTNQT